MSVKRARRAERLHQRDRIEVTVHVAARGHGDRDRAQQHRDQARETQEPRRRDRWPILICGAVSSTSSSRSASFLFVLSHSLKDAMSARAPANSSARVSRLPGWMSCVAVEVLLVHQQAGRQIDERRALVGPADQDARDAEFARADDELRADGRPERGGEPRIRPDFAARRDCRSTGVRLRRTARSDSITLPRSGYFGETARTRRQLAHVAVEHHAEHARAARDPRGRVGGFVDGLVVDRLRAIPGADRRPALRPPGCRPRCRCDRRGSRRPSAPPPRP